jgi:hypothetical protein
MKTLESILNSPERMLSGEEMNNLKGGYAQQSQTCNCTFISGNDSITQSVTVTNGDCMDAGNALSTYYGTIWDYIWCFES